MRFPDPAVVGVLALLVALPLGSAPIEIATGIVAALALWRLARRRASIDTELGSPLALVALLWLVAALARPPVGVEEIRAALSFPWALVLVLALPALALEPAARERALRLGLWSAAVVGAGALAFGLARGAWPWEAPSRGLFSHHLTLGYALLPPLAAALARRAWMPALGVALGVVAAGSSGPALALVVLIAGLLSRPIWALLGGSAAAVGLTALLSEQPALAERAVLWTSGALLALRAPLGVGPGGYREAVVPVQDALSPGFYFPNHAHDAALQVGAVAGFGAWIALAWLLVALWRRSDRAGRAALAALLVGGLTQDTLGDLEVVRALVAWCLLAPPRPGTAPQA